MGREMAIQELNRWYDAIGVPEETRLDVELPEGEEGNEDELIKKREKDDLMRERVIRAIQNGSLILNENNQLEYTLKDPVEGKEGTIVLSKLVFKNRYRAHELEAQMKGVKPDEFMPMTRAYIATLTGEAKAKLGKMYNRDMEVSQAVYTLFTRGEL